MNRKQLLADEFVSQVNGGFLPKDWQKAVEDGIINFINMPEEEFKIYNCARTAEGMLKALADTNFQTSEGVTNEEMQKIKSYILENFDKLKASSIQK